MTSLIKGDIISDCIANFGFFEWQKTWEFYSECKSGGKLFVDVGANIGYFSLIWLGIHARNRCISVEAAPRNTAIIETNILRNHLHERLVLCKAAASNSKGTLNFYLGPTEQTGWGGITLEGTNCLEVESITLDDLLHNEPIVDVLKIDVEGAELMVLQGALELIKSKKIRKIYFEENAERAKHLAIQGGSAATFLSENGYDCHSISPDDSEWLAYPKSA